MRGVSSLRGLKWALLLVVLAVSLGWKLGVRPGNPPDTDGRALQMQVAEFLRQQRLIVSTADRFEEGQPSVRAGAGPCRLLVIRSPAIGWDRDLIRRHAEPGDDVFVVYRGRIFQEQPTFRTVLDFLWARLLRELGLNAHSVPILAIIASKDCQAAEMPWNDLI